MEKRPLFRADNISKQYPGTAALKGVSMDIREGEVVGLVGENGAGKSTFLKIIVGVESQSSGTMTMNGKNYSPSSPKDANGMGVGMVFQEQSLLTNLTVGQNIFLGEENRYRKNGFINWKKMYRDVKKILDDVGVSYINPEKKVGDYNFATRQMVEIAKVLHCAENSGNGKSLILLDEPTSVLSDEEITQLFIQVGKLRDAGNAVIFVSHRLDEIIHISDRIFVFKDGENVGSMDKKDANVSILYESMVGKPSSGEYYKTTRQTEPGKNVVLEAKALSLFGSFKNVSFKLHEGEVLGICGVVGSGKEDLCSVVSGDTEATTGELMVNGKAVKFFSPHEALTDGIISIPKERREAGIFGVLKLSENISLSDLNSVMKYGFINKKMQAQQAREWIEKLSIKCSDCNERTENLSGGNAQKVVFARILVSGAKVLILNHPTRGVDIGAKEEIYSLIRDLTAQGLSVILLSDTLDECIGLSNEIMVMKDGMVTRVYDAPVGAKPEQVDIVKFMM